MLSDLASGFRSAVPGKEHSLGLRRPSLLLVVEALALAVWVATAGWLVLGQDPRGEVIPIDPEALSAGPASETWMGIYFEGVKAGYAVSSSSPTADGGLLLRNRSAFEVAAFGEIKRIVSEAYVKAVGIVKGNLQALHDVSLALLDRETLSGDEVSRVLRSYGNSGASPA